jgi:tetratricopeptide (TPR) repeat protein
MSRDAVLQQAARAIQDNALESAARILRAHLEQHPDDVEALGMLADVQMRRGRPDRAEASLRRALALARDDSRPRFALAQLLATIGRAGEALEHARAAQQKNPDDLSSLNLIAAVLNLLGEQEEAAAIYERIVERSPEDARAWTNYGTMLRMIGRSAEAIAAFQRSIAIAPQFGEAYWGLADLKTYRFSAAEIAQMRTQAARADLPPADRSHLLYALGKATEDEGKAAAAFEAYAAGASLRASKGDDPQQVAPFVERSIDVFTAPFFEARKGSGAAGPDPIFIVGLPRAGSTLIEHILASHSMVEATMELPDLQVIARELADPEMRGGTYLDTLPSLDAAALRTQGEAYLRTTRIRRKTGRPFFIDKQPSNWAHAGLIHLILPNAKIIDARRHPLACGWSCFKQDFLTGQSFTYDLAQFGFYYRHYVRLMAHYDAVLPGRVHRIVHEQLVTDPEPHIRALLAYCGLPFEAQCLRPHETQRAVRTSSSEQVRQPISAKGLENWRAYEPYLEPLKRSLGPVLDAYPDAPP